MLLGFWSSLASRFPAVRRNFWPCRVLGTDVCRLGSSDEVTPFFTSETMRSKETNFVTFLAMRDSWLLVYIDEAVLMMLLLLLL